MEWFKQRFELSRGGDAHNVRPMEGLRGFAVFLVFLVHYVTLSKPWTNERSSLAGLADALHSIGNTGVDLFFVLSGFLIYGSLMARAQPFGRFMSRRVERIYPTFLAVFATYVVLSFVFPTESKIPPNSAFAAAVYLGQNLLLLPGIFPIEPLITVAWSLSYEMFYYLAIPLVIGLFRLRRRSLVWRVALFLGLASVTLAYCAVMGGPVRLVMFISGVLVFEMVSASRAEEMPASAWTLIAVAAALLGTLVPTTGSAAFALKVAGLFVAFFLLCHHCISAPRAWLPRAFSWTPLRWLGNMSYSYYLLHGLTLKTAFVLLGMLAQRSPHGPVFFFALLPVMFVLTLLPTALLFLVVERPFSLAPQRAAAAGMGAKVGAPG